MVAKTKNIITLPMNEVVYSAIVKYNDCKNISKKATADLKVATADLKVATDGLPSNEPIIMGDYEFNRVESANPSTVDWERLELFLQEHGKSKKEFLKDPKTDFKEPSFKVKYIGTVE